MRFIGPRGDAGGQAWRRRVVLAWPLAGGWVRTCRRVLPGCLLAVAGVASALPGSRAAGDRAAPLPVVSEVEQLRAIAAGQDDVWLAPVSGPPLLVIVDQRGVDVAVEDVPPGDSQAAVTVDAPNGRWGPEFLVLSAPGEHLIHVRSGRAVAAGRYAIRVQRLTGEGDADRRRRMAFEAMSRGGGAAGQGSPESLRRALAAYREALPAWQAEGDRALTAEAVFDIADVEYQLGEMGDAVEGYGRALALWQEEGAMAREADTRRHLGLAQLKLGDSGAARQMIAASLALWRQLGEGFEEGVTLTRAGYVEQVAGSITAALPYFEQASARLAGLGASGEEARVLNHLGGAYDLLGESDKALVHYERSLAMYQALGNRLEEARLLSNIAVVRRALGDWQAALEAYDRARTLVAPLAEPDLEEALLDNLGFLYVSLGEPRLGLPLFERALALAGAAGDRRAEIAAQYYLGLAWRDLGDLERALTYERRALALAQGLGDARLEAASRLRIADIRIERGDALALADVQRARELLGATGSRRAEAEALALEGRALALAARPQEALATLREALARLHALHDRTAEAGALTELAALERRSGENAAARADAEAAVAAIESLRSGLASLRLRASYLATRHRAYTLLIDLLMERHAADPAGGFDRQAFAVSEQARARSLADLLHDRAGGHESGAPEALQARRRALLYRLNRALDAPEPTGGGGDAEALLGELDTVESAMRQASAPTAGDGTAIAAAGAHGDTAAAAAATATATTETVARLLDPGTLLLELALGPERSYAWAVDERGMRSVVLPAEGEIERRVRRLLAGLSAVESGGGRGAGGEAGDALARELLAPVWPELAANDRLVVVPDGAAELVPWSALRVPPRDRDWHTAERVPLLERTEVVEIPSATTLALARQRLQGRPPAARWAAVFADPVFAADDPRLATNARRAPVAVHRGVADPSAGFDRLPATRREADAIAALAPAGQVWKVLGLEANRDVVLSGELARYRIVHFATHSVADTRDPELSGLVLSQVDRGGRPRPGFLRVYDLAGLDLAADLVVLSGCQTRLGEVIRGEGLLGLARGFEAAGVPRIVASLWRVEDRAAAEIMAHFYRALWHAGASPAAALRDAQRALRRDPRFRDPHYWAAFVLQGDWRPVVG